MLDAPSTDDSENRVDRFPTTGLEPETETEMDTEVESEPDRDVIFRPKACRDVPASHSAVSQHIQGVADFPLSMAYETVKENP